ncbi:MAG: putative S-layer associated protein, partial [Firmicutes bacterium]|nr:putative S-layer associated protein [Bacillota bacterium]
PEEPVTRAEFVKLLLAVQGLSPQSPTAAELRAIAAVPRKPAIPASHWLQTQGWMDVALAHGLVVAADYDARGYEPDKLTNRRELMIMAGRTLGLVQPAQAMAAQPPALPYTDASTVPAWARSWVKVAADSGVVTGYPDGSIRTEVPLTRAEAVVVAQRVKAKAAAGANPGATVQVEVTLPYDGTGWHYKQIPLSVPVVFDGAVPLVPIKPVYDTAREYYAAQAGKFYAGQPGKWQWNPVMQSLYLDHYGEAALRYTAGTTAWQIEMSAFGTQPQTAAVPARLINGTLYASYGSFLYGCCVLPSLPPAGAASEGTPRYDAARNLLVVPVRPPIDPPNPS